MNKNKIKISTPGRICLFGEHQDYLGLPVIASAISKRISIEGTKRNDLKVVLNLPDISSKEEFYIDGIISYTKESDYFRSAVNVILRNGFKFSNGFECTVKGDIPINAGTSSSSALIITWINFLISMSSNEKKPDAEKIAEYAYQAEVLEFSEPGGMMDHYSTAIGGIIWLESFPAIKLEKINQKLGTFVLGNSNEPKDTKEILARVKYGVLKIVDELKKKYSEFSLHTVSIDELEKYNNDLTKDDFELIKGTIQNRDITFEAKKVLAQTELDKNRVGELLNSHQNKLREIQKISTNKINAMIDAAMNAGALGAKINGSGGGGCMFAYAPDNPEKVLEAVRKISNEVYIVNTDVGTKEEKI